MNVNVNMAITAGLVTKGLVTKYDEMGVYVNLIDYDNIEGMILTSEFYRNKRPEKFVNKTVPVKVLRVSDGNMPLLTRQMYIDLTTKT